MSRQLWGNSRARILDDAKAALTDAEYQKRRVPIWGAWIRLQMDTAGENEAVCREIRRRDRGTGEGSEVIRLPRWKVTFADVKPEELLELIERTFFAVSNDETRYNLNGVFFEPGPDLLRLVATDGHRLSLAERAVNGTFGLKRGVILPKKGLQELKKLLSEAAEAGEAGADGRRAARREVLVQWRSMRRPRSSLPPRLAT